MQLGLHAVSALVGLPISEVSTVRVHCSYMNTYHFKHVISSYTMYCSLVIIILSSNSMYKYNGTPLIRTSFGPTNSV